MKLEITSLTKRYSGHLALSDFTASFSEGIYGILGANGAGKSTLMNLITDNLKRDSGEIIYDDGTGRCADILKLGAAFRRNLGYMPQQQGFYERMTAGTFLFYMAELKGLRKKQAKEEIDRLLDVTSLTDVRHKKLSGFSGGMRQRVLLAQALLGNPRVLILDEPTAGLDPKERIRIRNFISSLSRDRIILLATHIVSDIEFISDKISMMKNGKLVDIDTAGNLTQSVIGKVKEFPVPAGELPQIQARYKVGNVFQRGGQTWARLVGDTLPEGGEIVNDRLTLEDVYLYYLDDEEGERV